MYDLTGYHYTSWKNWESIQTEGLVPYEMDKPEIQQYFSKPIRGVWLWQNQLSLRSELGSILYQMAYKNSLKIVKLEVKYRFENILRPGDRHLKITHFGEIENWPYHEDSPEADIVTTIIAPTNIKLMKVFNILDLVK